ncbi:MAG: preprotein translocase subunit SecE [Alphaproteobacteria bacterium]|nr:preprotein translocase subunit SecE [Alphaproteobacteria bacterium]
MGKINFIEFVQETRRETSKITWPTRKETTMTTVMIVVMALLAGLFFFAVDSTLGFVVRRIFGMAS